MQIIQKIYQKGELLLDKNIMTNCSFGTRQLYKLLLDFDGSFEEVFFPDAYIYSDKIRYRDLFREKIYAAYSERTYNIALKKLLPILGDKAISKIILIPHLMSLLKNKYFTLEARNKDSCLLMLPKSTTTIKRSINEKSLKTFVEILKSHYKYVNACIYWSSESCLSEFQFCDIFNNIYSCGPRNDMLFYPRLSYLFTYHTSIASFNTGSHTLYSALYKNDIILSNEIISESRSNSYQDSRYPSKKETAHFENSTSYFKHNVPNQLIFNDYLDAPYSPTTAFLNKNKSSTHQFISFALNAYDKFLRNYYAIYDLIRKL